MDNYIDEIILSVFEDQPLSLVKFDDIREQAWKKIVARSLMRLIDEGKVKHVNNRYYRGF